MIRFPYCNVMYVQCPDGSYQMLCRSSLLYALDTSFDVYDRVVAVIVSKRPFDGSTEVRGERLEAGGYLFKSKFHENRVFPASWLQSYLRGRDKVRLYVRLEVSQ